MARKKKKKPHHKKKRRVSGSPSAPVIGKRRKRGKKKMGKSHKKKRRMGASDGGWFGQFIAETLGVGAGLISAEIATVPWANVVGNVGGTITKAVGAVSTYGVAANMMKPGIAKNFVKGVGIGFMGSAINDGVRAMRGAGIISGAPDVVMTVYKNPNKKQIQPAAQPLDANGDPINLAVPMSGKPAAPVIGAESGYDDFNDYVLMNG